MLTQTNAQILQELAPEFAEKINKLLDNCKSRDVEIVLRDGRRNTITQAVYWRRSRSKTDINNKIEELQLLKADFLAYCLFIVGDQTGPHATNAVPGLSWHQFGMAVDCTWMVDSKACWDNEQLYDGVNGYDILAFEAKKLSICSGHDWENFRDSGHLQANFLSSPLDLYSWEIINKMMSDCYLPLLES